MMLPEVRNYLERVRCHLRLDPAIEREVVSELYTNFEEKIAELRLKGLSAKEATKAAIESFGRARVLSRLLYEACSKGSWGDAVLASLPHFLMAGLFAFGLWQHPILAPVVFICIIGVTLLGWRHGKSKWLYSWIGYALAPLLIGGYVSIPTVAQAGSFFFGRNEPFPNIGLFLLIAVLFLFFLWVIVRTTVHVVRRDWILASLMLVPLPILASWLFNIEQAGGLFRTGNAMLHQWDAPMALALAVLGATAAIFVRLRQRVLKVGAVMIIGSIALVVVAHNLWRGLNLLGLIVSFILMLGFLYAPTLLEKVVGHGEEQADTWWGTYQEQP